MKPSVRTSLNRLVLTNLPSKYSDYNGMTGYQLLSTSALNHLILQHHAELDLPPNYQPTHDTPMLLNQVVDQPIFESIAHEMSQRLTAFLLVLRRGDEDYTFWKTIQHIWLSGGLVAGALGKRMVEISNLPDCHITSYPTILPLIGMANRLPHQNRLVFDFGSSFIKRGIALHQDQCFHALRLFSKLPAKYLDTSPELLLEYIVKIIAETWQQVETPLALTISISVASYVENRQPISDSGYGNLRQLACNVTDLLNTKISQAIQQPIDIDLFHDGTAAAMAFAGSPNTAVIAMGTALGYGFAPD